MLWTEHDFTADGEVWWKKVESKSWCTFWDIHCPGITDWSFIVHVKHKCKLNKLHPMWELMQVAEIIDIITAGGIGISSCCMVQASMYKQRFCECCWRNWILLLLHGASKQRFCECCWRNGYLLLLHGASKHVQAALLWVLLEELESALVAWCKQAFASSASVSAAGGTGIYSCCMLQAALP